MKKVVLSLALVAVLGLSFTSCKKSETEATEATTDTVVEAPAAETTVDTAAADTTAAPAAAADTTAAPAPAAH
jgi:hypothetical protein